MDINIIRYIFIFMSLYTGIVGLLINYMESYLSPTLVSVYLYGKFSKNVSQNLLARCKVPKSWFKHFYIFAAPAATIVLCLVFYKYLFNGNLFEIIYWLLDISFGTSRKPLASAGDVVITIMIFTIHCWKRLYETSYVNIFSDQKINISHYLVAYVHYPGTLLCIIGESEGFVKGYHTNFSWYRLTTTQVLCACIFLWSSYMQLRSNYILANLRKNKDGHLVTKDYKIPFGGLFDYITSPLQFTEVLIYLMLSAILWKTSTFHYVTIWVVVNQVLCAVLSHQWYHETFKNYPKGKKILIPYIW